MKRANRWLSLLGLIAMTAFAQVAQAATCTVNNGLINPPNSAIQLNGVAGVPGLVIGVGQNGNAGVVYVNGVAATLPAGTNQLNAVSVASSTYAVAVGEKIGGTPPPLIQFNGTTWTTIPTTGTPPTQDVLGVKTYGPNQTYAADKNGIYFFNGTTWSLQQAAPGGANFSGLWGNATTIYGLADDGTLYTKAAATPPSVWSITGACLATLAGNGAQFNGITGDAAGNVYVTGQDANNKGFIYKYDPVANTCTNLYTSTGTMQLNSVAVDPTTGAITAVGDKGAVVTISSTGTVLSQILPVNGVKNINGVYIAPNGTTYMAGQTSAACTSAATVTPASGGGAIPSSTAGGAWTTLTGPVVTEANVANIGTGAIILNVPAGFVFDITGTAPTVLITGDTVTVNNNINHLASGTSAAITSRTATQITFTVTFKSAGTIANILTWQNIRVRPTLATPLAIGNITETGTATGFAAGTNFGTLTEVAVAGPDHIRIQHDGNGLTCTPEILTVIACANATCTAPHYTASAVTGNVTWAGAPGGLVPFNIAVGGTTTVSLPVTTVQTVTLGTSAVSPAPTNPSDCWNTANSTTSCSLPFADSGLLVSAPNHVSETVQNITISAVRKANNALNCVPAFANVSRAVNLKCVYANPTTGTLPTRVTGSALNATNNANAACDATGQLLSLSFNASGTATTTLQYADVGQMSLNATYTGSAGTGDAGLVMTGSGSFIAASASFAFSGITAAPIKAGNNFSATVTAKNNVGNPTPNFGKETVPEGVTLSFSKYQPTGAGAANGIFSGSVGAFGNGAATATNLNWSEVGNGDLTATLTSGSYLGSGFTATGTTGTTGTVGRFIPDHFDTSIINGCLGCGFTYSGQPFTVYVTARNGLVTPTTTVNYDGTVSTSPSFAKAVTLSAWDAVTGATQNPGPGLLLPPSNTAVALTAFSQGMASLNVAATMPFYTFTTVPTTPTIIRVRAVDTDNVTSLRVPLSSSTEGQPEIRSGRIKISNAHGSELLQLPIAVTAQYWNASSNYVTSTTDSSISFVVATPPATSAVNFGNYQKNLTTVSVVGSPKTVTFSSGVGGFNLAAPGAGNNGSVDMSIPALTGASCYVVPIPLGCYLPSNMGRATFGVYKGGNEFIYMRENY